MNIKNKVNMGSIFSACLLNNNNQIDILVGDRNLVSKELIKIYDINGNIIKELNNSDDGTYFIDSYYDNKYLKIIL